MQRIDAVARGALSQSELRVLKINARIQVRMPCLLLQSKLRAHSSCLTLDICLCSCSTSL